MQLMNKTNIHQRNHCMHNLWPKLWPKLHCQTYNLVSLTNSSQMPLPFPSRLFAQLPCGSCQPIDGASFALKTVWASGLASLPTAASLSYRSSFRRLDHLHVNPLNRALLFLHSLQPASQQSSHIQERNCVERSNNLWNLESNILYL